MPSGGDQSPPPPPPPPAAAASEEEEDDDGEAEDAAQPARTPTPQTQQRFDELCSRLNMDEAARAEAWDSYRSMSESYTLEVSPGEEARGVPGLVAVLAAGMGPLLPPGRAPCRGSRARPWSRGLQTRRAGILPAHLSPGNLAVEALLSVPEGEPCLAVLPFGVPNGGHLLP